jgi:hypothetical protein
MDKTSVIIGLTILGALAIYIIRKPSVNISDTTTSIGQVGATLGGSGGVETSSGGSALKVIDAILNGTDNQSGTATVPSNPIVPPPKVGIFDIIPGPGSPYPGYPSNVSADYGSPLFSFYSSKSYYKLRP